MKMYRDMTGVEMAAFLNHLISKTPFAANVGAKVTDAQPGYIEIGVDITPALHQHHGFLHGAVVGFLADTACAYSAGSLVGDVLTSEYKINLLAPAVGERAIARAKVIKASGRTIVTSAEVFCVKDGEEKLVAFAVSTINKIEAKPGEVRSSAVAAVMNETGIGKTAEATA